MLNNKGLSLVEVLIVLAIIGIFAFVAVPYLGRSLSTAKLKATQIELQTLKSVLNTYYIEFNKYPGSLQTLVHEKFVGPEALKDGWNKAYIYKTFPDTHNNPNQKYILSSAGKDGISGNNDDMTVSSE